MKKSIGLVPPRGTPDETPFILIREWKGPTHPQYGWLTKRKGPKGTVQMYEWTVAVWRSQPIRDWKTGKRKIARWWNLLEIETTFDPLRLEDEGWRIHSKMTVKL